MDLSAFSFAQVIWLPRKPVGARHGECLIQALKEQARVPESCHHQAARDEPEGVLLWDKAATRNNEFYGWVAAESTVVKLLRRHLTGERGVEHETISFMAYWFKERVT